MNLKRNGISEAVTCRPASKFKPDSNLYKPAIEKVPLKEKKWLIK